MSLLRLLLTYLMRNDRLVNKLADSKPIRLIARRVAYLLLLARENGLLSKQSYIKRLQNSKDVFKKKLQDLEDEIKKNTPKK